MPKAFISYARDGSHGENLAAEIQQQLLAAGFAVFRDVTELKPGDTWPHKLEFELETSDVMVLVLSEKVRQSKWVHNEFSMAEERHIPILPVLAESISSLPLWMRHLQVIDFSIGHDWGSLLDGVQYQTYYRDGFKNKSESGNKAITHDSILNSRLIYARKIKVSNEPVQYDKIKSTPLSLSQSSTSSLVKGEAGKDITPYHNNNKELLSDHGQSPKLKNIKGDDYVIMTIIMVLITVGAFWVVGSGLGFFSLGVLFVWLWTLLT